MGHIVKIGHYEIIDAELNAQNLAFVSIPCHTNPGLTYQLDGWDAQISVPASINGKSVTLAIDRYDKQQHHWILKSV